MELDLGFRPRMGLCFCHLLVINYRLYLILISFRPRMGLCFCHSQIARGEVWVIY